MNPNTALFDEQVRRRISLERYSRSESRRLASYIDEVRDDLIAKIARLKADGRSQFTIAQQKRLLANLDTLHRDIYSRLSGDMRKEFDGLARSQAAWEAAGLRGVGLAASINEVSASAAFTVAKSRPMQGRLLKDWLKDLEPAHRSRLSQALRISFTEGENLTNTLRRVRNATLKNGRGLTALVRTANTHIAAAVTAETYKINDVLIEKYEWRAILDGRTTRVCMGRDGQSWEVGKGPMPPAHISCRSTTTPILKGFPPPPRDTYSDWLKRQSVETQNDILGRSRGILFRKGEFALSGFVDKTGRTYTLAELGSKK